jgi:type II secretory pathway pseudopilin PulG
MRLRDRSGIEGLPLRLMVVALLISLTLPIALGTLQGFEEQAQVRAGMRLAEQIGAAATSAYTSGEGNVRVVKLDWPEVPQRLAMSLMLAGSAGSVQSSRVDVVLNGEISGQHYLSDPLVRLVSANSTRLEIVPGCQELRLSCFVEAENAYVLVEVA